MRARLSYRDIAVRAQELLPRFGGLVSDIPYEDKGILSSEMLFLAASLPQEFSGRLLESGRARGQSTLVLSLTFPDREIESIEYNRDSPDVPVAEARLKGRANVTLLFGDSEVLLPQMLRAGDAVLIDGPKMFRAVRLAIKLLATGKPVGVFVHDMGVATAERRFLALFFPEATFSDNLGFARIASVLDQDAVRKGAPLRRLEDVQGEFGYGYGLAYLPLKQGRSYRLLLHAASGYDALGRCLRLLRLG
jgi:hypothetical protein